MVLYIFLMHDSKLVNTPLKVTIWAQSPLSCSSGFGLTLISEDLPYDFYFGSRIHIQISNTITLSLLLLECPGIVRIDLSRPQLLLPCSAEASKSTPKKQSEYNDHSQSIQSSVKKSYVQVLHKFLEVFSRFDWDAHCLSLNGPIPLNTFPDPKRKHF